MLWGCTVNMAQESVKRTVYWTKWTSSVERLEKLSVVLVVIWLVMHRSLIH